MKQYPPRPIPQLIALDLDETLLDRDSRIPPGNRTALEQAIGRGIEVAVATGRAFDTIPVEMQQFPGVRFAITGNGAAVYQIKTGETIYRKVLPAGAAQEVLRRTAAEDVQYEVFVNGSAYAQADYLDVLEGYMMDEQRCSYVRDTRKPVPDIRDFILTHSLELDSLAVIPRNMEVKARVTQILRQMNEVYITTSSPRLIEINHRDCTKAAGLRFLSQLLGVPQERTAAFGNGDNDAEMLEWAGCGVSVAEGTALCRAGADYVTGSYLENGVAQAFHRLWSI